MLLNLHIKNFALIEELEIDFQKGLNVLTGETGAGKSILIDAVNLVLGGRGLNEFIRSGEEKAAVSAVFDITDLPGLKKYLPEIGLEVEDDLVLLLSRELTVSGKNLCRVNGRTISLSMYKEIGRFLIDIHGQHDHHFLLDAKEHMNLLDGFGSNNIDDLKSVVKKIYDEIKENKTLIKQITGGEKDRARQKDVYEFQLAEIDKAYLNEDEDAKLEEEKIVLANAEKLSNLTEKANLLIYESDNNASALDQLYKAIGNIKEIKNIDESVTELLEAIEGATYQIEEAARDLRNYKEKVEFNPNKLEEIENRLDLIKHLKRKYGDTIEEILKFRNQIATELEIIDSGDEKLNLLQEKLKKLEAEYMTKANELTSIRQKLASHLEQEITKELQELLMPQVKFKIQFFPLTELTPQGIDQIEFLISPNPGEPLKSLAKIASGGELSRIMLAFKTTLANLDQIPTLIFDEIDSGLGGRAAHAVAEKLDLLSEKRQVICVTHSPQVASFGSNHLYISKTIIGQRTVTTVETLNNEGRVEEIARMLGGKEVTDVTVQHARELLAK